MVGRHAAGSHPAGARRLDAAGQMAFQRPGRHVITSDDNPARLRPPLQLFVPEPNLRKRF